MKLLRSKIAWDDYQFEVGLHADVSLINKAVMVTGISYYRFAYVRNPWERILSAYFFDLNGQKRIETVSFEEYIKHPERLTYLQSDGKRRPYTKVCPFYKTQWQILSDKGTLAVDRVMRFERYQEEWEALCNDLEWDDSFKVLPSVHRQDRSQYKGQYTPELIDIVGERYGDDIVQFGYEFPDWLGN